MSEQGEKWVATDWDGYGFRQLRAPGGVRYRPQRQEPNMESLARVLNAYEAELEQLRPRAALASRLRNLVHRPNPNDLKDWRIPPNGLAEFHAIIEDYDALETGKIGGAESL